MLGGPNSNKYSYIQETGNIEAVIIMVSGDCLCKQSSAFAYMFMEV